MSALVFSLSTNFGGIHSNKTFGDDNAKVSDRGFGKRALFWLQKEVVVLQSLQDFMCEHGEFGL